jgi:acetyltransferase-like isoleucine patch superfamily enzyme
VGGGASDGAEEVRESGYHQALDKGFPGEPRAEATGAGSCRRPLFPLQDADGDKFYLWLNKFGNTTLGFEIGEYTYGHPTVLYPNGKLKIGKFCSIAWNVTIFLGGNHRIDWIATYPFPTPDGRWPKVQEREHEYLATKGDVTIGNDVWIGSDVTIMSGLTIGDGAVIGTGSVVTRDVEPYAIVAGNPAKLLRKRFTEDQIATLLEVKWWDWPIEKIRENVDVLCSGDIERLTEIG